MRESNNPTKGINVRVFLKRGKISDMYGIDLKNPRIPLEKYVLDFVCNQ